MKLAIALIVCVLAVACVMPTQTAAERVAYRFETRRSAFWYFYTRFHVYDEDETCRGKPDGAMFFARVRTEDGDLESKLVFCGQTRLSDGSTSAADITANGRDSRSLCKVTPESLKMVPLPNAELTATETGAMVREHNAMARKLCVKYYGTHYRPATAADLHHCFDSNAPQIDATIQVEASASAGYAINNGFAYPLSLGAASRRWAFGLVCPDGKYCTSAAPVCEPLGSLPFESDGEFIDELQPDAEESRYYVPGTDPTFAYSGKAAVLCIADDFPQGSLPTDDTTENEDVFEDCQSKYGLASGTPPGLHLANLARGFGFSSFSSAPILGISDYENVRLTGRSSDSDNIAHAYTGVSNPSECGDWATCDSQSFGEVEEEEP